MLEFIFGSSARLKVLGVALAARFSPVKIIMPLVCCQGISVLLQPVYGIVGLDYN